MGLSGVPGPRPWGSAGSPQHQGLVDGVSQLEGVVADRQVVLQAEGLQDHPIPYWEGQPQLVARATAWEQAEPGLARKRATRLGRHPAPRQGQWQGDCSHQAGVRHHLLGPQAHLSPWKVTGSPAVPSVRT